MTAMFASLQDTGINLIFLTGTLLLFSLIGQLVFNQTLEYRCTVGGLHDQQVLYQRLYNTDKFYPVFNSDVCGLDG